MYAPSPLLHLTFSHLYSLNLCSIPISKPVLGFLTFKIGFEITDLISSSATSGTFECIQGRPLVFKNKIDLIMALSSDEKITFDELIEGLLELFDKDKESVVIEDVQAFFNRYLIDDLIIL